MLYILYALYTVYKTTDSVPNFLRWFSVIVSLVLPSLSHLRSNSPLLWLRLMRMETFTLRYECPRYFQPGFDNSASCCLATSPSFYYYLLIFTGRLRGHSRRPHVLHWLQLQFSIPGRTSVGSGHSEPSGVSALPIHHTTRLSLALHHWHLQDHLPLSQLWLPGEPLGRKPDQPAGRR